MAKKTLEQKIKVSEQANRFEVKMQNKIKYIKGGENDGSMEFDTFTDLAKFLGIKNGTMHEYVDRLKDAGFIFPEPKQTISLEDKIQDGKKRIKNGENGGSMEFATPTALSKFLFICNESTYKYEQKLKGAGFVFPEPRETISFDERLKDGLKRIKKGENNGSMKFSSLKKLRQFLGTYYEPTYKSMQRLKDVGFIFPVPRENISFETRMEDALKRIKNGENEGSMEFATPTALNRFLGTSNQVFLMNEKRLKDVGFKFPDPKETISLDERVEDGLKRIKNGENDGSMEFASASALGKFLGAKSGTAYEYLKKLKDKGFKFPTPKELIPFKDRLDDGLKRIKKGENNGSMEFATPYVLSSFLGISSKILLANKKKLRDVGFIFPDPRQTIPVEDRLDDGLKRIKNGENDGSMEFTSSTALANFLCISNQSLYRYEKKLKDAGFVFPEPRHAISFDERAKDGLKRIKKGENDGSMEFAAPVELSRFIGVSTPFICKNREKLEGLGYVFPELKIGVSKNIAMAIEECKSQGVLLERGELLSDISKEFFSKHIRPLDNKDDYRPLTIDIVKDFSQEEKIGLVKESVIRLMSEERDDYSMLELKLELFVIGIYLSEESIVEALMHLGENVDRKDSIQKRLRLSTAFVNHGFVKAEYVDTLPMINNSLDGNVMLDKRINNNKTLMKLWKEYTLYSIKNNISGHVSKTKIPDDWDDKLDSLFYLNPSYEKAYLLDSESVWFLKEVGYEGVLAMCQFGSKQSKSSLTKMYHSIHARCIGFFMYLNRKKYALLQPKFIIFTGAHSVSDTARVIVGDHVVMSGFRTILKMDDIPKAEHEKMNQKNVDLLALKFAASVLEGCDLSEISSKDLYAYLEHSSHEAISGTIILETLVFILLRNLGNKAAIKKKKEFDFNNEVLQIRQASELNNSTLKNYKKLLSEMIDVVRREHENRKSNGYIKQYLSQVFVLMRFLDTFEEKLNRKEMVAVLNTVIVSDVANSFATWAKENLSAAQYVDFTTKMFVLFDNIADDEYKGLYSRSWRVSNKRTKTKTLIREGINAEAYKILQHVAIYNPPRADEYPFIKTTPEGDQLDLSWWLHDFSPIPVMCNWLIIKTTRRKGNVRQLDVNSFLRFDEDGDLTHIHFNTDKNRDSKESDISINLLRYLFATEELELLKKYVDYIKNAYSGMTPISYESTSGQYEKIMPLFPHHKDNAVIADNWIDGYHIKTMLKTEMIVKSETHKGTFDHFIEDQDRKRRKNDLAKIKLVTVKPSGNKKLPESEEVLDGVSLASYAANFSVAGGVHNMRHAGISSLGAQLPLVYVRLIAGHADINTTARVYFHANEDIVEYEIKASINEPVGAGSKFIHKKVMPFIENENPKEIEQILLDNHFMAAPREILHNGETKMVEDGLAQGTKLHPSLWVPEKHGVCTNNKQCPPGTNGCCALCPFNLFSPMHIKGVIYELNECLEAIALISQKVALDARDGVNISREEMKDAHQQKIVEMAAWFDVLEMINEKMNVLGYSATKNLPASLVERTSKDLYSMGTCSMEESMMELLVDANTLQINDIETGNRIAKMSHKLMQSAIYRKDYGFAERVAYEGIQQIVNEYGKKAIDEKKEYLLHYLETGISISSPLETGNNIELLPAI
ncbi:MAG: Unknown protein [uncultured Sulfurovum sp.]|uniref:Uncharacterized protein n=1 Tax=uncultured Sulfurovum sp. TaxID=269237 RepID=A0A6S6S3Q6_9BACT|nr:MAG: Unknown protein [uncultured Sulfurovum sp.]